MVAKRRVILNLSTLAMSPLAAQQGLTPLAFVDVLRRNGMDADLYFREFGNLLERCPDLRRFIVADRSGVPSEDLVRVILQLLLTWFTAFRDLTALASRERRAVDNPDIYLEQEPVQPPQDPLRDQQRHLNAAPLGIHLAAAESKDFGSVRLVDVEQGWNLRHEELRKREFPLIYGLNHRFPGHGTAVLGILAADGANDIGGTGIVPRAVDVLLSSEYSATPSGEPRYSTAYAIAGALDGRHLRPGDILLIEAQLRTKDGVLLPVEAQPEVRAVIECAFLTYDVLVVEAAGNGGVVLDGYSRETFGKVLEVPFAAGRQSRAIIVGAATADESHAPMFFSNRGTAVSCFAWGEDVTTCGDGATSQEIDDYRSDFRGTSAAAAIVAGVAALVQSIATARGKRLEACELRHALMSPKYGTVTSRSAGIGVMPDVQKLLA